MAGVAGNKGRDFFSVTFYSLGKEISTDHYVVIKMCTYQKKEMQSRR